MSNALEKAKAKEQLIDSIRDLYNAKISLPLGNPNLKLVHTNQFLFTELPTDVFELANMDVIATALNSTYSRYSGYTLNRWYIEGITITNDGHTAKMDLELNPFASNVLKFRDDKQSFGKAYTDATTSNTTTSTSNKTKVKSVQTGNTTLKGGQGTFIDNLVKKLIGKETNDLKKAKIIHSHLCSHLSYSRYCCGKYGKNAEKAYKARKLNCGDTSMLTTSMMRSAGLTADVVHGPNHFWTRIKINGKEYFSDATSSSRSFNSVWNNLKYYAAPGTWCGCEAYPC